MKNVCYDKFRFLVQFVNPKDEMLLLGNFVKSFEQSFLGLIFLMVLMILVRRGYNLDAMKIMVVNNFKLEVRN
jgi:hypothetical protein